MLSDEKLKYYKGLVDKDKSAHDTQLKSVNSPEDVISAYNGKFTDDDNVNTMIENHLFIAATTVLPGMFYQVPRMQIQSKRPKDPRLSFEAAVLTALINGDFDEKAKEENQLCIIDAFLPYGYAVMKNGYNSRTKKVENKPSLLTGKQSGATETDMEGEAEFIEYERSLRIRQSPKSTYLDSTQPFGKGNRVSFIYDRTLQQLEDSNMYNLSSNFISHYGSRVRDHRELDLKLTELWIMEGSYAWKLAYIDGWPEELAWVKTEYKELPISLLRFTKMGDVLYGISHGTLGYRAQKELNYLNELWKKHVDNIRNQHLVDESALTESGKKTIKQNDIGGIVTTTKPITSGISAPLTSQSIDPALFGNIASVREYLKLIFSATGSKAGGPEADLATTQRIQALGDSMRTSGMQDEIRMFVISQVKQTIKNYLRLSSPERILSLSGEGLINPLTGMAIPSGANIEIGGERGFELKELIEGDPDLDFSINVDITSAARPDYPVIRKQMQEGITLLAPLEPKLNQMGKKVQWDAILEDYFSTFDAIPDAKKYIADMTDEDKARLIQSMMPPPGAPGAGGPGVPTEGAIAQGAGAVPTGTEGLGI